MFVVGEEVGKCGNDEGKKGVPATTLRSKHSETEQRRRSKINERQGGKLLFKCFVVFFFL